MKTLSGSTLVQHLNVRTCIFGCFSLDWRSRLFLTHVPQLAYAYRRLTYETCTDPSFCPVKEACLQDKMITCLSVLRRASPFVLPLFSSGIRVAHLMQACNNLPESGVVDHQTWVALLGVEAHPGVLGTLRHGDHRDDDMLGKHHEGMVFLIGEQRWASRKVDK